MAGTWSDFRSAVEAAVSGAMLSSVRSPANNDGPTVSWAEDRRPFARHRLLLDVVSTRFDHDRDSAESTGGDQDLSSMATIVVQITAESAHAAPTASATQANGDALWLLEQVRLGLRRVAVREALLEAECPIVGYPVGVVRRSYPADGRIISAFSVDVTFRYVFLPPAYGEIQGQIEHVEIEGDPPGDVQDVEISVDDPDPDV